MMLTGKGRSKKSFSNDNEQEVMVCENTFPEIANNTHISKCPGFISNGYPLFFPPFLAKHTEKILHKQPEGTLKNFAVLCVISLRYLRERAV